MDPHARVGLHARVSHTLRLALLVWPTRLGPKPKRPTWPSPCGSHGHAHATTWSCLHMAMPSSTTRSCLVHGQPHG
ncbi:hypothetical protein PVK06_024750 [Gossypium arboreum]|uniref:Secreted protein n=1 Tax=Gossypium arboreum TaxID=29729 RepID=A0ABR0PEI2_GOSAR|nr:hypothetical protein PVK06_024750 [Gossypium arboreum]